MSASVPSPGATKAALAFRAQYVEATEGTVPLPDGGVFCTPAERDGVVALRALVAADIERLLPPDERFVDVVGDVRLLRFYRARPTMKKRAEMYRNFLQWRVDVGMAALRREMVDEHDMDMAAYPAFDRIARYYPVNLMVGEDAAGDPISIERTGEIDPKGMLVEGGITADVFMRFHRQHIETKGIMLDQVTRARTAACVAAGGKNATLSKGAALRDLRGISMKALYKPGLAVLKKALHEAQNNYPEQVKFCALVNCPWVFYMLWKIVSVWIDKRTMTRIKIFPKEDGKKRQKAWEFCNAVCGAGNLPRDFGGTSATRSVCHVLGHRLNPRSAEVPPPPSPCKGKGGVTLRFARETWGGGGGAGDGGGDGDCDGGGSDGNGGGDVVSMKEVLLAGPNGDGDGDGGAKGLANGEWCGGLHVDTTRPKSVPQRFDTPTKFMVAGDGDAEGADGAAAAAEHCVANAPAVRAGHTHALRMPLACATRLAWSFDASPTAETRAPVLNVAFSVHF